MQYQLNLLSLHYEKPTNNSPLTTGCSGGDQTLKRGQRNSTCYVPNSNRLSVLNPFCIMISEDKYQKLTIEYQKEIQWLNQLTEEDLNQILKTK